MTVSVIRPAAECGTILAHLPGGGPYRRVLPRIEGPRPDWASQALWQHFFEDASPPDALLVDLANAVVLGPGIVRLADDTLVAESLLNCDHLDHAPGMKRGPDGAWQTLPLPPCQTTLDAPHLLLRQMWDVNYGHWLLELLPRLAVLDAAPDETPRMLVTGHAGLKIEASMHAVQAQTLAAFGIAPERITRIGSAPVRVERLLFSVPLTRQPWLKAPLAIAMLEALAARQPAAPTAPTRLFVRRGAEDSRQLLNEAAVADILAAHGFVAVTPGGLDFAAQLRAFHPATHIVGTLGAGCANLVFSQRGVRFLGLAPADMQDDFFYDLVSLKAGTYACLHGPGRAPGMNAAFTIDEQQLRALLHETMPDAPNPP